MSLNKLTNFNGANLDLKIACLEVKSGDVSFPLNAGGRGYLGPAITSVPYGTLGTPVVCLKSANKAYENNNGSYTFTDTGLVPVNAGFYQVNINARVTSTATIPFIEFFISGNGIPTNFRSCSQVIHNFTSGLSYSVNISTVVEFFALEEISLTAGATASGTFTLDTYEINAFMIA